MMLQAAARSRSAQRGEPLWGWSWYRTEASHTPASRCPEQEPEVLGPPSAQTAWVRQGVSWSDLWGPDTCHVTAPRLPENAAALSPALCKVPRTLPTARGHRNSLAEDGQRSVPTRLSSQQRECTRTR